MTVPSDIPSTPTPPLVTTENVNPNADDPITGGAEQAPDTEAPGGDPTPDESSEE